MALRISTGSSPYFAASGASTRPPAPARLYPRVSTATVQPRDIKWRTMAMVAGVFPAPPAAMLPTEITGRGRRVFAFAGLADNEQFFGALRDCGAILTGTRGFPDHHRYTAEDLASIRNASADLIVTTEKDAVKIDDRDIIAVRAEMEIEPAVLEAILARTNATKT